MNPDQNHDVTAVTEDEVLAGEKVITIAKRKGGTCDLRVRALSTRTMNQISGHLARNEMAEAVDLAVTRSLDSEQARDRFLDTLVPGAMLTISNVAMNLSSGVDASKKAAAKNGPLDSQISSPSSAS